MIIDTKGKRPTLVKIDPNDRSVVQLAKHCGCSHEGYQLVLHEREGLVRCSKCKGILDPFVALLILTRDWARHRRSIDILKHERNNLAREIDELKRERRNLRAQVRRAGGTTP